MDSLTIRQKEKLKQLESELPRLIVEKDFVSAAKVVSQIQAEVRLTSFESRGLIAKARLCEALMDSGKLEVAKDGFIDIRSSTNKRTRLYLEASVLLAVCYIRSRKIDLAEPIMEEVLTNDSAIKSESKRKEFRAEAIKRFSEEGVLFGIKGQNKEAISESEVELELVTVMGLDEDELYKKVGSLVPKGAVLALVKIDGFSKKLLPSAERKLLPGPIEEKDKKEVGKTLFSSVKRVIYNSLCDPNSDIYKAWFNNGLNAVLDRRYIVGAVTSLLAGFGIGAKAIIVSIIALIFKFTIEVYCDKYRPVNMMELR